MTSGCPISGLGSPARPAASAAPTCDRIGLCLQVQERYTSGFGLNFDQVSDVVIDGSRRRLGFLIGGQLNSCLRNRCGNRIDHHDEPLRPQIARVSFMSCKYFRLTALASRSMRRSWRRAGPPTTFMPASNEPHCTQLALAAREWDLSKVHRRWGGVVCVRIRIRR